MIYIVDLFTQGIKNFAHLPPQYVLGTMFLSAFTIFLISFIISSAVSRYSLPAREFLKYATNIIALSALSYCLAESHYVGKSFTLLSSLLTVSIFFLLGQFKNLLILIKLPKKTEKKIKRQTIAEKVREKCYLSNINQNNFKNLNSLNNDSADLKPSIQTQLLSALERARNLTVEKNETCAPDIELGKIKDITDKFKNIDLSAYDSRQLEEIENLADDYISGGQYDANSLNTHLGRLLKLMSKYNI